MDPLAAMAGAAAPAPSGSAAGALPELGPAEAEGNGTPAAIPPEDEDKMMLIEDFRQAPAEDALAAFDALLSAFGVKRS